MTNSDHGTRLRVLLVTAGLAVAVAVGPWRFSHEDPSTTYNYLTTADWGDDTLGQYACAAGMGAVATEIDAQQVFMLGDNFYPSGIHAQDGPDGERRFKKTFEDVYAAEALQNLTFWAIAGNHDHLGNVSAQLAYSRNHATRFTFPAYWYNVTQKFEVGGKTIELEILLIDTVIMVGNSDVLHQNGSVSQLSASELPGSPDPALAAQQTAWLEQRMRESTADYLWVGGHYPVWAIGQDRPTGVNAVLRPLLNKWEAQYFNGHEHDLEHIIENSTKVNYISTGAGKECCYEDTNANTVPIGSVKFAMAGKGGSEWQDMPFLMKSGFTSYRIAAESMKVYYHAHNGTVLYVTPPILPRTKQPQPPIPPPGPFYPPPPPKSEL